MPVAQSGFIHVVETDGSQFLLAIGQARPPRLSLGEVAPLKHVLPELAHLEAEAGIASYTGMPS